LCTALDSIIWTTTRDEVSSFSSLQKIKFPKCFELSEKALKLTNKFNGISYEEKEVQLEGLVRKIEERINRIF
jgi:hypothetical protein